MINWQQIRLEVLERDHYQCQTCLKRKVRIKEYLKIYRERNRQKINQRALQLYWLNHDDKIQYRRTWYLTHKDIINFKRPEKYRQRRSYNYTY